LKIEPRLVGSRFVSLPAVRQVYAGIVDEMTETQELAGVGQK